VIQPDGQILLAGYSSTPSAFVLMRLNTNGTMDNTFGTLGKVVTEFTTPSDAFGYGLALQSNGKMAMTGRVNENNITYIGVSRYLVNGLLDNSFANMGKAVTLVGSLGCIAYSIVIQPDGKILVAGKYDVPGDDRFAVVRYNTNGTLDNSFAGNGKAGISFGGNDRANAIALQTNGRIVTAGITQNNATHKNSFALARLNTDGTLDNSFGTDGKTTTTFSSDAAANAIAIQANGRIVVAGSTGNDIAVARYLAAVNPLAPLNGLAVNTTVAEKPEVSLAAYPNPAVSQLRLTGLDPQGATLLEILDATGKTRQTATDAFNTSTTVNIENLSAGVYFMEATDKHSKRIIKFVKK